MKWFFVIPLALILLLTGCRSTEVKTRCEALKIAENNLPSGVASRIGAVACELDGSQGAHGTYFVDFKADNVKITDLGPEWTIGDANRVLYPGDAFNLLTIRIDKGTGQIVSKVASNGIILGHPGMLPDCSP